MYQDGRWGNEEYKVKEKARAKQRYEKILAKNVADRKNPPAIGSLHFRTYGDAYGHLYEVVKVTHGTYGDFKLVPTHAASNYKGFIKSDDVAPLRVTFKKVIGDFSRNPKDSRKRTVSGLERERFRPATREDIDGAIQDWTDALGKLKEAGK